MREEKKKRYSAYNKSCIWCALNRTSYNCDRAIIFTTTHSLSVRLQTNTWIAKNNCAWYDTCSMYTHTTNPI